jgi:hypothetical protein
MRAATRLSILAIPVLSMALVAGCEVDAGPVGEGPPDAVSIGPGYYYDEAYIDVGGVHHPREYWYHDDHGWAHRDALPAGVVAHDRASVGYTHGTVPNGGAAGPFGGSGGFGHGGGGGEGGGHGR